MADKQEKDRRRAWEFALGMIQTDGLVPTPDFMAVVERNIRGEISDDDILNYIKATYAEDREIAELSKRLLEQNRAAYNILAGEPQAGPIWDEDTQRYI